MSNAIVGGNLYNPANAGDIARAFHDVASGQRGGILISGDGAVKVASDIIARVHEMTDNKVVRDVVAELEKLVVGSQLPAPPVSVLVALVGGLASVGAVGAAETLPVVVLAFAKMRGMAIAVCVVSSPGLTMPTAELVWLPPA